MTYPDVNVEEWCKKHCIEIDENFCPGCGQLITEYRPYVTKEFAGVVSRCPCGKPDCEVEIFTIR